MIESRQRFHAVVFLPQDLPPLKRDLQVTFYKSAYVHHEGGEQKMPTLEAVFKTFPDIPINIDVKEDNEKLIRKVCMKGLKAFLTNQVCATCGNTAARGLA